jgi:large subunit ribosomal protein L3
VIRGMIGRKLGMMRLYDGGGQVRAVTVIELGPNRVTQLRTVERDGYEAVQIGYVGNRKRLTRPQRGHLGRAGLGNETLSRLQEFPADNPSAHETGEALTCDQFEPGQYVDVSGVSKGRGFAGGVKRWGFHGGPKTHGQSDRHRSPGSIGSGTTPGRVRKGLHMAGHMGDDRVTIRNLKVFESNPARGLLLIQGPVPGAVNGLVRIRKTGRKAKSS